jgi:hypothetical protein
MTKKELEQFLPKFRKGALSMKEYNKLSRIEKDQYVIELTKIPIEELGDVDKHLLRFHNLLVEKENHFYSLED